MRHAASPLRHGRAWLLVVAVLGASAASLLLAPLPAMLTVAALLVMLAADESVAEGAAAPHDEARALPQEMRGRNR
jgi:hypothetical protein